jgi:hypothetical protein
MCHDIGRHPSAMSHAFHHGHSIGGGQGDSKDVPKIRELWYDIPFSFSSLFGRTTMDTHHFRGWKSSYAYMWNHTQHLGNHVFATRSSRWKMCPLRTPFSGLLAAYLWAITTCETRAAGIGPHVGSLGRGGGGGPKLTFRYFWIVVVLEELL